MRSLLVFALLLSGCGGSPAGPSVPTTTLPATVVARDGISGEVVTASIQHQGGMVSVTAPGFLARTQPTAPTVYLWKQSEEYVRALVYDYGGAPHPNLQRWNGPITMAFRAGLDRYDGMLREHAAEVARVTRLSVQALSAGSAAAITLEIAPEQVPPNILATTQIGGPPGSTITEARIRFRSEAMITTGGGRNNTLLHELGHAIGLGHSPLPQDVMADGLIVQTRDRVFGDAETKTLTMMYSWRKAGNTFPDSEAQGLASGRMTYTVYCH